ncbi:unnamed protein product [Cuscuta epithymum]|uniref:Uncharacterized protein n=1 Tax=Cuscuta epithymum TaxID=186058 RepID=A0AAV0CF05_9ASTE|nr:unnamed protein product [Cuscuta epithymum]CAH9138681.1 unnamed protein product [Cuscuta epithymum]
MTSLPVLRIFLPLLLLFGSCCSTRISLGVDLEADLNLQKDQREFDYFMLSLEWPGTECNHTKKCCSANGCCRSNAIIGFTIHGLWAEYNGGKSWPSCCEGSQFNETEISSLLDDLNKYWPSYRCGTSKTCHASKGPFWAHERNMEHVPIQLFKMKKNTS